MDLGPVDLGPADLGAAKVAARVTVSVCLPARDEAPTIGAIVRKVREAHVEGSGLVDEVVVVDDGSSDETADAARRAGARVVAEASVLPEAGRGSGKGNALWKSLHACDGDVICWLDADLRNFDARFVARLVAPLLLQPDVALVKGYYRRPFEGAPTGGGRVTELVARPLLSLLFPKLAHVVQPLGGEYAGRRDALEVLPFVEGWGVELGLLIDVVERFGLDAVAQVDLGSREHRNRPVEELAPQALAVMAVALRRAGMLSLDAGVTDLLRVDGDHVRAEPVIVRERPPITTFAAYARKRARLAHPPRRPHP